MHIPARQPYCACEADQGVSCSWRVWSCWELAERRVRESGAPATQPVLHHAGMPTQCGRHDVFACTEYWVQTESGSQHPKRPSKAAPAASTHTALQPRTVQDATGSNCIPATRFQQLLTVPQRMTSTTMAAQRADQRRTGWVPPKGAATEKELATAKALHTLRASPGCKH